MALPNPWLHPVPHLDPCLALIFPGSPPVREAQAWEMLKQGESTCLDVLRQEGLCPYLYTLLNRDKREEFVAPALLEKLRHDYYCAVQATARQESEAVQVIQALLAAGVAVTLLKGADLRLRVYSDPAARPMTDLDFLVVPEQAEKARAALKLLGYRPMEASPRPGYRERFLHADGFEPPPEVSLYLDLHWDIREGDGFYRLPYQDLTARSQEVKFHGLTLRVLSPEHLLIHLCLHLYWEFSQLRQVLDLALVAHRLPLNWAGFAADAQRWGCTWPVSRALDLGHALAPHLLPAPAALGLTDYRPSPRERLLHARLLGPFTPYLAVLSHHPAKDWLAFAAAKLWPDREFLLAKFGSASRGRYLWQFVRKFKERRPGSD